MSNSTTLLDLISSTQSNKEVTANAMLDALSPASIWGRRASTTTGLTWGYYGGNFQVGTTANAVANGTVTLTASTTNYIQANATTGAVSVNTTGFTAGAIPLYSVVTGTATVTSYTDYRSYQPSATAASAVVTAGLMGSAVQTAAYTMVTGDRGNCLTMNSSSAVSQALPTPTGSTGNFPSGWWGTTENIGAGAMTLTVPSGLTLDGVSNGTLTLAQNTGIKFFTDGTNWFTIRGAATGGGGGFTNPMTTAGDIIIGGAAGAAARLGIGSTGQVLTVVSGAPAWAAAPTTTAPVSLVTYVPGTYAASAPLIKAPVPVAVTFPINLTGSVAKCDTAPTGAVTCAITRNGTSIGSVNFAASATTGTFTFSAAVTITAGDVIAVTAPSSADATFAGAQIALLASAPAIASNTTIASMGDANITSPGDGQMMVYSAAAAAWQNIPQPDGGGFVDGNFDSWQVGTSFSLAAATDTYTADMWVCNAGTGGAATVSQSVARGVERPYMTRPRRNQLSFVQTTASTGNPTIGQRLEDCTQYNGQTIQVQASLVALAAATLVVGIQVTQNFGTGGSPSSSVVTSQAVSWAVGTTGALFKGTIAVPSTSGKTFGTNNNDFLRVDLLLATGATFTLLFSQMQIDVMPAGITSPPSMPFRYRGPQAEMARVRRYVRCFTHPNNSIRTASVFGSTIYSVEGLDQPMRAAPACSLVSGTYTALANGLTFSGYSASGISATDAQSIQRNVTFTTSAGTGASQAGFISCSANVVELLDARL